MKDPFKGVENSKTAPGERAISLELEMAVRKLLPYGVKDYYPKEVKLLSRILRETERELTLWGYEEIKLPTLEYKELFETALGKKLTDGFLLKDCEGGDVLALRYDFTPQILRFVLHRKERSYPLRVFYKGETFKGNRELWEELHVGFELVGAPEVEADAEVMAVIENILSALGIKDYLLVVGHRESYRWAVQKWGIHAVEKKTYSPQREPYLKNYPLLGNGWENLELPPEVKGDLSTLRRLFTAYGIGSKAVFNPSLEPERDYYSGLFFKVVSKRGVLARGGRYDRLFERFGEKIPATGGGLKINLLLEEEVSLSGETPKRVYVIDKTPDKVVGWKIAKYLRQRGIIAERDIVKREPSLSVSHAVEKGFPIVLVVEDDAIKLLTGGEELKLPLKGWEEKLIDLIGG